MMKNMRITASLPVLMSALLLLTSISAVAADLDIVTTHSILASIARTIGGDHVNVDTIHSAGTDPHFVAAKPSFMTKARRADLWIRIGMDMEVGFERLILEGSRNRNIQVGNSGHLDASEHVLRLEVPTGRIDRSMGDVHPLGNPHYWLDPWNGRIVARTIADRLSQLDPANAADYNSNYTAFAEKLDEAMFGSAAVKALGGDALWQAELDGTTDQLLSSKNVQPGGWYATMKPFAGKAFITYHKSWTYFANRFGLRIPIQIEPKPGIPPGPGHTLQVINTIKSHSIPLLVVEPYYNIGTARSVADKTGAKLLVLTNTVGGCDTCTDYISTIDNAVRQIAAGLK